jgi:hypothetical protein
MPVPLWLIIKWKKEERESKLIHDQAFRERVAFDDNRRKLRAKWKLDGKADSDFKHIMQIQKKWKGAMRWAIKDEIAAFKRKKTLDVLDGGQVELARLYQLPGRHADAYQVGHRTDFVQLLSIFLREKTLCWEDLSLGENFLLSDPLQIDSWMAWHRSYSETYDNLFVLPKVQNSRASRRWVMMPSRQFGAF